MAEEVRRRTPLASLAEEFGNCQVSVIIPQRWGRGKLLYVIIRYGTLVFVSLELCSESTMSRRRFASTADASHLVTKETTEPI